MKKEIRIEEKSDLVVETKEAWIVIQPKSGSGYDCMKLVGWIKCSVLTDERRYYDISAYEDYWLPAYFSFGKLEVVHPYKTDSFVLFEKPTKELIKKYNEELWDIESTEFTVFLEDGKKE